MSVAELTEQVLRGRVVRAQAEDLTQFRRRFVTPALSGESRAEAEAGFGVFRFVDQALAELRLGFCGLFPRHVGKAHEEVGRRVLGVDAEKFVQLAEALGVAVAMNAGAALVYSARALDAVGKADS